MNAKQDTNRFIHVLQVLEYVHKIKKNREEGPWAWFLVVLSEDFLVNGTAPAKKKPICAEMKTNT